ncbi:hypothetical protein HR060_04485 [Catenovulum sp. SM1970]|uniref:hypothetical protein n=1 Tax=Marinifaba aquimaris TaxID=2741323 RepID=UPI001573C3A9|nr:hypothetical protein [Marinifaba aquimaris]NTS76119.1 hypothetical protein [Marinifaba aquimaris]
MDYSALIISIVSLLVALSSFVINQKWKKLEFVGQEMRHFKSDIRNQAAMKMLDWNSAKYLHPELFEEGQPKVISINDDDILKGLGPIKGQQSYTIEQKFVRDCFDHFFDSLEVLETHIEQGLIPFNRYQPYLTYYVDIMQNPNSKRKSPQIQAALKAHMQSFGFDKALRFCDRYTD